jgi:Uma2 family endonuclease
MADATARLTYTELCALPDDGLRHEIIEGQHLVTPAPGVAHQHAVARLLQALMDWADAHGGVVLPAPTDVYFGEIDVVEPDVVVVTPEHRERVEKRFVRGAPDVAVEVSSPSTRQRDRGRKRALYEREGVGEFWFVDLDAEQVELHRREGERFAAPVVVGGDEEVTSPRLPGFALPVRRLVTSPLD